ncbi:ATP-binding protein [Streptomyces marispadix]|uniref:ATP-binding protein n=1 Tax=Streptomyces marispadix TaxID=2922868 RepID=A0ABS9T366_9ACTN|nr:ATP-binding protein [Streptomyces marispadix]MCH6162913.1 ATP-binding protein [Streptomyces marispadix]
MDMESPHRGQGTDGTHGSKAGPGGELPRQGSDRDLTDRGTAGRTDVGQAPKSPQPSGGSRTPKTVPQTTPPPRPTHAPVAEPSTGAGAGTWLTDWLRTPRPEAEPGIWRHGYRPLPPRDPDRTPTRQLLGGALVAFLIGWLVWSLLWNGYLGDYWLWPLLALTPESWRSAGGEKMVYVWLTYFYYAMVIAALAVIFGRLGHWPELARRARTRITGGAARDAAGRGGAGREHTVEDGPPAAAPPPLSDPVEWPELRGHGASQAADLLASELRGGRMNDVDHARIRRAWESVKARPARLSAFVDTVLAHGAAACVHPSGRRDLPHGRAARHDLSVGQVRIGTAADSERNPHPYRGAGMALEPELLGTSALAVGPPGSGKTTRLARPVTESLCLQALAGQAAVVVATARGERLAPDECFDVVVRPGDPGSSHDLDLYGGTADPDEAAGMLAEALVGDLTEALPGGDSRRAATALAQLIGPFRAVHGRFPGVPELRELLDVPSPALVRLRGALEEAGLGAQLRELDAYERQSGRPGDAPALLADRVALLDRPAFSGFFVPAGAEEAPGNAPGTPAPRPFSLRALEKPLRVRVDLPERGHAEASRILARLVLAQFTECATAREDQSLFAGLVLDDAAQTVTPQSLRCLQRVRSAHGGVLLTLRALDEVPEQLRGPLLGAVGCRMVCAGVTPWDAEHFAEVWGTEWVETRDVTNRQLVSDEPFTKVMHAVRRLATGRHVTAESVTVRRERRERWSASDLANDLPPGHAVLSLTTVRGERTPPILAELGK